MYIGDRLLNPDEEYGLTGSDDDWEMTTGNLKTILGNADVAKHFLTSMQEFAKTNPDRFWNKKLGPDQIAAIQRMYAIEKNLPGGKFAMHEHQRVLANKAYFAYKENQWIKPPKTGEEEKDKILIDELYENEENAHEKVENSNIKDLVKIYNNTNKDNKENTYTRTKEQLDAIKNRIKKDDKIDEHLTSFVLQLFSEIEDQFENDSKRLNLWDADTIEVVLFKKKNELEKLFKDKPDQFTDEQKELISKQFERFEQSLTHLDILEHYSKIFAPYKESAEQKEAKEKFVKVNKDIVEEAKKDHAEKNAQYEKAEIRKEILEKINDPRINLNLDYHIITLINSINLFFSNMNFADYITDGDLKEILDINIAEKRKNKILELAKQAEKELLNEIKKQDQEKIEELYNSLKETFDDLSKNPDNWDDLKTIYFDISSINKNKNPQNSMQMLLNLAVRNNTLPDFEKFHESKVDELYKSVKESYAKMDISKLGEYLTQYNNLILLAPDNEPQNIGEIFMRLAIKKRCFAEFQKAEIDFADSLNDRINRDWLKDDFDETYFPDYLDSYKELQLLPQDAENEPKNILDLQSHLRIGIAVISCMVNQDKKNESKDSKQPKATESSSE
jgi:hypothetical protein